MVFSPAVSRVLRFIVPLLAVLAALAWVAWTVLETTARRWAEKDVALRAELAVSGAREALATHLRTGDRARLARVLTEVSRDDRIMATAVCRDGALLASTTEFPSAFTCGPMGSLYPSTRIDDVRGGPVHVSTIPVVDDGEVLGSIILIHDLSFAARREATMRWFSLIAFAVLAVAAALVTMFVARLSWRRWTSEVRQLVRGKTDRPEFKPILRDVRDLVARLAIEGAAAADGTGWGPERLRRVLRQYLHGEKVVIVANREPYIHERAADGAVRILHPASGLVTALEPVMRACSGVWVAHGSGSGDRETVDRNNRVLVPPGEESYAIRRVWLSPDEENGYYYSFANEGLWPLCHIAHNRPTFRSEDWAHYKRVNEKFADAVVTEVDSDDPIILVQDYHFALAPRMIRERLPRATILNDDHGVLVLSRFTGAAKELTDALIVNPYDLDQASDALAVALAMPGDEQEERMRAMRSLVSEYNVYRWAGRMLVDSARVREQDRHVGRRMQRLKTAELMP